MHSFLNTVFSLFLVVFCCEYSTHSHKVVCRFTPWTAAFTARDIIRFFFSSILLSFAPRFLHIHSHEFQVTIRHRLYYMAICFFSSLNRNGIAGENTVTVFVASIFVIDFVMANGTMSKRCVLCLISRSERKRRERERK